MSLSIAKWLSLVAITCLFNFRNFSALRLRLECNLRSFNVIFVSPTVRVIANAPPALQRRLWWGNRVKFNIFSHFHNRSCSTKFLLCIWSVELVYMIFPKGKVKTQDQPKPAAHNKGAQNPIGLLLLEIFVQPAGPNGTASRVYKEGTRFYNGAHL